MVVYTLVTPYVTTLHFTTVVMPIQMASYMMADYGHAHHGF
jgi:hypothetical protein